MHEERVTEWLKSIGGVATALSTATATLLGVYVATHAKLAPIADSFGLRPLVAKAAALLPLLPILWFGWRSYRRFAEASRVEQPDRFALSVSTPEGLIGRAEELANLLDTVGKNRVVLLDGESGCGKSALVAAGLVPRLLTGNGLLPVAVRDWGDDWVRGPLATALGALFDVLTPEQRTVLEWTQAPDLGTGAAALGAELGKRFADIAAKLGRRPLLITDQFDDYQAQHRAKFLDESGCWLKPDVLATANPFWGLVSEQLRAGAMHLLAVSRADTASGLSCLRFLDPAMTADRKLPRVDLAYLRPLLERIAPNDAVPAIVSQPNQGWSELRERLEADLRLQGAILMQQVRTVLLGIRQLPVLTIAAYRRAGELRGMESLVVARAISRAGDAAGGGEAVQIEARRLVGALVLPGGPSQPPKARRVAFRTLAGLTSDGSRVTLMLRALQANDVVRPAEGIGGEPAWQLDHDYLAHAVLAEARQADRWGLSLSEGLGRFRNAAGDWRRRWAALLPVTVQVRMAWERVRGRLRYGEAADYARLSLMKPGLALLVVGVASVGTYALYEDRLLSAQARAIYERFGGADEMGAVLTAWRAPVAVRDRIFRLVQEDGGRLERATRSLWPLAHGGLEINRLTEAARLVRERLMRETDPEISSMLARIYAAIAERLTDQVAIRQEVAAMRERLVRETNPGILWNIAQAHATVAARLSDQTAIRQEVEVLRERWASETNANISPDLALAYATVAVRLSDQAVRKQAAEALRERMVSETAAGNFSDTALAYATVAASLSDQIAIKQAAEALRVRMARGNFYGAFSIISRAYAMVAESLSDQTAIKQEVEALGERMARETDVNHVPDLAQTYAKMAARLSDQTAIKRAAEALRVRMEHETGSRISLGLARAYATIAARLSDQTAIKQAAGALRVQVAREADSSTSLGLARAYATVAARLSDQTLLRQEVDELRERVVRDTISPLSLGPGAALKIYSTSYPTSLGLAQVYAAVAVSLSDQTAVEQATEVLRERMARETAPDLSSQLALEYAAVAARLSDQPAIKRAAEALRERMAGQIDAGPLLRHWRTMPEAKLISSGNLPLAYATVAVRLSDQASLQEATEALRERLACATYISTDLADAYAKVARRHLEAAKFKQDRKAAESWARQILTLAGHPFLGDATPLLAALEPIAGQTFGSDTGAAVAWWVREFNGEIATLRHTSEACPG